MQQSTKINIPIKITESPELKALADFRVSFKGRAVLCKLHLKLEL